jgi:hypothetical protein
LEDDKSADDEEGYVGDVVDKDEDAADEEYAEKERELTDAEELSVGSDSKATAAAKSAVAHSEVPISGNDSPAASYASSLDESDDEQPEFYADLMKFPDGIIGYYLDEKTKYWYATYDRLSVRQMKELLKSRGQGTSGKKALLINRLQFGDKCRVNMLKTDHRFDKLAAHEWRITEWLAMRKNKKAASRKKQPPADSSLPSPQGASPGTREDKVEVEDASRSENEDMDVDIDAEDLFKSPPATKPPPASTQSPKTPAPSAAVSRDPIPPVQSTPPVTIATKSTASTAQSTVSSLQTPATVSSHTGRLLNQRPRRNPTIDGIANFVSISCPPRKDKNLEPSAACHASLRKVFTTLKRLIQNWPSIRSGILSRVVKTFLLSRILSAFLSTSTACNCMPGSLIHGISRRCDRVRLI